MYKHGVQGELAPTLHSLPPSGAASVPVYIGTAPVEELADSSGAINTPIMVHSFTEAETKLGYSDDWAKYTLCEAMSAHFRNSVGNIGPIILINVLDPAVHTELVPVAEADIIGGVDAETGERSGIACIDLIYQMYNVIPFILAAPGWSHMKTVKGALEVKAQKINGHWDAVCVVDLDSTTAKTIDAAKTWKATNEYNTGISKVCWPKAKSGDRIYWLSTLAVARMQLTDYTNDNVPYESPSNKPIPATSMVLADGSAILFDELQANTLNADGITTMIYRAGQWVLWGSHNGNFKDGSEIDARDIFDCGIRTTMYLTNDFQARYFPDVDKPLSRSRVDTILNDSQIWLNSLVIDGKLLYAEIAFNETSNPVSSIVEGDFVFDVLSTTVPAAKSLTFKVRYTTQGISALFEGGASA